MSAPENYTPDQVQGAFLEQFSKPEALDAHPEIAAIGEGSLHGSSGEPTRFRGDQGIKAYASDVGDLYAKRMKELGYPDEAAAATRPRLEQQLAARAQAHAIATLTQRVKDEGSPSSRSDYWARRLVPFAGIPLDHLKAQAISGAAQQFQSGQADSGDYQIVAEHLADKAPAGFTWQKLLDTATKLPSTAAEYMMFGGPAGAATGGLLKQLAVKAGSMALQQAPVTPLRAAAAASLASAPTPQLTEQGLAFEKGKDWPEAFARSAAADVVQNAAFGAVDPFTLKAGHHYVAKVLGLLAAGEVGKEGAGLLKAAPEGGTLSRLAGARTTEERQAVLGDLLAEGGGVALFMAGMHAAARSGSARPSTKDVQAGMDQVLRIGAQRDYSRQPLPPTGPDLPGAYPRAPEPAPESATPEVPGKPPRFAEVISPPAESQVPGPAAAPPGEPPVPPGMVRYYRGEAHHGDKLQTSSEYPSSTNLRGEAERFLAGRGGSIFYADVPRDWAVGTPEEGTPPGPAKRGEWKKLADTPPEAPEPKAPFAGVSDEDVKALATSLGYSTKGGRKGIVDRIRQHQGEAGLARLEGMFAGKPPEPPTPEQPPPEPSNVARPSGVERMKAGQARRAAVPTPEPATQAPRPQHPALRPEARNEYERAGLTPLEEHAYAGWRTGSSFRDMAGDPAALAAYNETLARTGRRPVDSVSHETLRAAANRAHEKMGGSGNLAANLTAEDAARAVERGELTPNAELHGDPEVRAARGRRMAEIEDLDRKLDNLTKRWEAKEIDDDEFAKQYARLNRGAPAGLGREDVEPGGPAPVRPAPAPGLPGGEQRPGPAPAPENAPRAAEGEPAPETAAATGGEARRDELRKAGVVDVLKDLVARGERTRIADAKELLIENGALSGTAEWNELRKELGQFPEGVPDPVEADTTAKLRGRLGYDQQNTGTFRKQELWHHLEGLLHEHHAREQLAAAGQQFTEETVPAAAGSGDAAESHHTGLRAWADQLDRDADFELKDKLGNTLFSTPFDPSLLVPVAKKIAAKIIKGGYAFADWSADAARWFGESVRPHLQAVWDRAQQFVKQGERVGATGIKNATVDQERAARNLPPAMEPARRSFGDVWDQAMEKAAAGPGAADRLITELKAKPRAVTDKEDALLLHRQVELSNDYDKALRGLVLARNGGDALDVAELEGREKDLRGKLKELYDVNKAVGTETGRGLNARKMMAKEDFSLDRMMLEARAARGRDLTPQEQQQILDLHNRIKELQGRLDESEGRLAGGKVGSPTHTDWMRSRVAAEDARGEFRRQLDAWRKENQGPFEKLSDLLVKIRQNEVISSPATLLKVASASAQRLVTTPLEEVAGAFWSRLPGLSKIAALAPRQGRGLSPAREYQATVSALTEGLKDAWRTMSTGRSELDVLHGKDKDAARSWLDVQFALHAALKAPAVRGEFTRSFLDRIDQAAARGQDSTSPAAMLRFTAEAYRDSQAAKFQQENWLVDAYNRAVTSLREPSQPLASRGLGLGLKLLTPVVRIPTNLAFEVGQHVFGTGTGTYRAVAAWTRGLENLKPEQADLIMQSFKKGSLGLAVLTAGMFMPNTFGGYYSGKRDPNDVPAGGMRIGGFTIPSYLLHNPLLETAQFGATIGRAFAKTNRGDATIERVAESVAAGGAGLAESIPLAREAKEAAGYVSPNARERGWYLGQLGKSLVVPQFFQWLAGRLDTRPVLTSGNRWPVTYAPGGVTGEKQPRKAVGVLQGIQEGVPLMRNKLPAK